MKFFLLPIFSFLFQVSLSQQLNFQSFSFEQGLNTYNIQKVVQDKYGYIWIATQDGLYRYNGKTFQAFRKFGTENSLRENFMFDIYYDNNDLIYIGEFNAGIDVINVKTLAVTPLINQRSKILDGLPNLWIKKVYCDNNQNIWIGGKDYLSIFNSREKKFIHILNIPGFNGSVNVSFLKPIDSLTMAVGVQDCGILLYDMKSFKFLNLLNELLPFPNQNSLQISDLLIHGGDIYLSSNAGIISGKLENNSWKYKNLLQPACLMGCLINCIAFDSKDYLWIGTNSGLARLEIISKECILIKSEKDQKRSLEDNTINYLTLDDQNNLWICTSKVLQKINLYPNPFRHYTSDLVRGETMNHVYSLVPKSENEIFCTATDGLYITNILNGEIRKVKGTDSLGVIHYLIQVKPGYWFVCSNEGMYAYLPEKGILSQEYLLQSFPEWKQYIKNYFNNSITIGDDIFWASEEEEGLLIWDTKFHLIKKYKAGTLLSKGIPENHIHNIKQDNQGNIWLLCDNSVAKYQVKEDTFIQVIRYSPGSAGFNSGIFFDMYDDGTTLWFGTFSGGLNGYDKKNNSWIYITEKDGLCNNCIYGILPEKDSVFWVSTNMGISRVNYVTKKCNNYYFEDGLQDNSFDEKGALQKGRQLFFGGINGFTSLDLSDYYLNAKTFPVYIDQVEYLYKNQKQILNNLKWQQLNLPPGTSSISIHLSALYFANQKTKFAYKITGVQDDFLDVGDDNKIILNALHAGDYSIVISYRDEKGELINNQLSLKIVIEPFWYQTFWFKILLGLALLGMMYALYRFRINQILKQQQIRREIAGDLHDDLGATLNSTKIFTRLAKTHPEKQEYFEQIDDSLNHAYTSLRDMIWVLDDTGDTIADLVKRIKQFGEPVANANNIRLQFSSNGNSDVELSKPEKRNLLLIAKEGINNCIKYAECKNIHLSFKRTDGKITLIIEDDGCGFDEKEITPGNGLKNIRTRAKQIHYTASIDSKKGEGTRIVVTKR